MDVRYAESMEESAEILRLVLQKMSEWRLSFTPVQYTVVYEYVTNINSSLKKSVDDLLTAGSLTDKTIEEAYYSCIIPEQTLPVLEQRGLLTQETLDVLNRMSESAKATMQTTQKARFGILSQHKALKSAEIVDASLLQSVIAQLAGETKKLLDSSEALENNLRDSRQEIENLRSELQAVAQASTIDPLTGIANRRGFEKLLGERLLVQETKLGNSSFLFLDIDHFKKINDDFGHIVGDRVLQAVAKLLKAKTRGEDIIARFGGEEFVVVLPGTPIDKAHIVAESIRQNIERITLLNEKAKKTIGSITVSIGIDSHKAGQDWHETIQHADKAMYQSKQSGRNRITTYFKS